MAWKKVPAQNAAAFHEALPDLPGVELRKMFGCPAGFVNGNLFCGAHEEKINIRLAPAERESALALPGFTPFTPMGPDRPMKEYVCIPADRTTDIAFLQTWMRKGYDFASSLPPKAKKARKKKAAS